MSSPTVGPEPNFSQGGAPEGQAGWSAAPPPPPPSYGGPAQPYGSAPAGYGAAGQRPTQVTAAAIIGIVIGGLGCLGGLLALVGASVLFALSPILGIFAILSLAAAVILLVGGIQALQGKSPQWLIYGCYASIAAQLLYLIFAMVYGVTWFFGLLGFILPIVIVVMLMQPVSKQYYAARNIKY
jgi:hypothetical protein